ncbi:MAG: TonB-dependent receptor, partial [Allosphingosinicella sp.]
FDGLPGWLKAFGAQANATYIKAEADFPVPGGTRRLRIPDVSKWTYNLVGMYEAHGLTLRLAYNKRTGFPEGALSDRGGYTLQGRGHSVSRLDWSSSYAFNDNLTLFFDWTNILGKPFKSDIVRVNYNGTGMATGTEIFPLVVRFEETVVTGGIRFRF